MHAFGGAISPAFLSRETVCVPPHRLVFVRCMCGQGKKKKKEKPFLSFWKCWERDINLLGSWWDVTENGDLKGGKASSLWEGTQTSIVESKKNVFWVLSDAQDRASVCVCVSFSPSMLVCLCGGVVCVCGWALRVSVCVDSWKSLSRLPSSGVETGNK